MEVGGAGYIGSHMVKRLNLLEAMYFYGVGNFIFIVVGCDPWRTDMHADRRGASEKSDQSLWSSELMVEQALVDCDRAYGVKSVSLRYFNAAGADPDGELGERHEPETHLIPLVLQAASGRRRHISVFGRDYDTPDGTCIRDYIHIMDLCEAHWQAVQLLLDGAESQAYNLGNGNGFSVQEVIDAARRVTGREIAVVDAPRREGDPARLVADSALARKMLGWTPKYADLETIIRHAWAWEIR